MLIGIDANEANVSVRAGIGVFAFSVLWEMYKQIQNPKSKIQNHNLKFKIYLKEKPLGSLPPIADYWEYQIVKPARLWTQFALPLTLWQEKLRGKAPDVFLSLTHYSPRFCPAPSVICIMDLAFLRFPELFLKRDLYQLTNWTNYSVRQAKKIITISEFSKKEIIDYYQVIADKVIVTYPGYDRKKFKIQNSKFKINEIKQKYQIVDPYLLFVGTLQPRKNLVRLLEAFKELKTTIRNLKLVICGMIKEGRGGWMQNEIFEKLTAKGWSASGGKTDVIITGYVGDSDLPYLMAGAEALVLPSLYEGFGIPVLEAMAVGVPVVVSNVSSLPEIVKDAGILVDPIDVASLVDGIYQVCYNQALRNKLIKKGLERTKLFNWEKTAKKILDVLKNI